MGSLNRAVDRSSFGVTVAAGLVAAFAGGYGWTDTAIISGIVAASAPIVGRIATNRLAAAEDLRTSEAIASANERAEAAVSALQETRTRLAPRQLSAEQSATIASTLNSHEPFKVTIAHNRHEAEPGAFHAQMIEAFKAGGIEVSWFGGMTNSTVGIEVSGPDSPQKAAVMGALSAAGIDFLPVECSDDPEGRRGVEIWIGVHPGVDGQPRR